MPKEPVEKFEFSTFEEEKMYWRIAKHYQQWDKVYNIQCNNK